MNTTIALTEEVAVRLHGARMNGRPIAPVRDLLPPLDVDAAYEVQQHNVRKAIAAGRRVVGRKIGLTSKAVQQQLGVDQPDFGVLFDNAEYSSGEAVSLATMIAPRIEAEFAFLVGRDIRQSGLDGPELAAHVDSVCAAIEIVDSAIADWDINIVDTVADNASCGGFVLGPWTPYHPGLNLPDRQMRLTRNGEEIIRGVGAATLGDPLNALAWLAETGIRMGDPLREGEIVLTGALGPMKPLTQGDYVVEIEGFPLLFLRAAP